MERRRILLIRHGQTQWNVEGRWQRVPGVGRPPGEAVHTIGEILDLVSRQRRLNFEPGEHYLYNNTAYTLLGVIVARVSGQSFQDFCHERLFAPLGMTSTQWRVDHRQVVKGRATAYRQSRDRGVQTFMSITDVVGNGGLLTTVGDLLRWNANLDDPTVGGRALVDWLETRGRLNDGTENEYARGLTVTTYKGLREVSHGGSTAGYQTFLARFPDARLSVAVLCNTTGANPSALAHRVADVFLGDRLREPTPAVTVELPEAVLKERAGLYRDEASGALLEIAVAADGLHAYGATGPKLLAVDAHRFVTSGRATYTFETATDGGGRTWRVIESSGTTRPTAWHRVEPVVPASDALGAYAGRYWSPELEVAYTVTAEHGTLWLRFRGAAPREMTPADRDGFVAGNLVVRFTRGAAGEVDGFTVYAGRVWHLRFDRVAP